MLGEPAARILAASVLFLLGFLLGSRRAGASAASLLSKLLLYLVIPAIIIYKTMYSSVNIVASYAVLVTAIFFATVGSAYTLIPRILGEYPGQVIGAAVLAAGIHNAGFLPIPLMLILYGDAGPAALYATLSSSYAAIVVPIIISRFAQEKGDTRRVARSVLTYPPFIALLLGVSLRLVGGQGMLSASTMNYAYVLSANATLLSFYLVGASLRQSGVGLDKPVTVIALWRLAVEPTIALTTLALLGSSIKGLWRQGIVLESFMPPATMNIVVSMIYGLDYKTVAKSIGLVTPISITIATILALAR